MCRGWECSENPGEVVDGHLLLRTQRKQVGRVCLCPGGLEEVFQVQSEGGLEG